MSKSLIFAHFLFFDERCERFTHDHSFPLSDVSKLLRSLFKNEWCERIAFVAHQKWATMSDSLTSLRENERLWANCSCGSPKMSEWVNCSFFEWIAQTPIFGQKTSDSLGKPMSEFPALPDPARRPGITPPPNRQQDHIRTCLVQFSAKTCCSPPPPFPI